MIARPILRLRLICSAALFAIPGVAHAEPVVFDGVGLAFFVVAAVITGSLAWWRHNAGDRISAVAVWTVLLVATLMVTRYGPNDTMRFFASMLGA